MGLINCTGRGGEVGRHCESCHNGMIRRTIYSNSLAMITLRPAEEGGIQQVRSIGTELADKDIPSSTIVGPIKGTARGGKIYYRIFCVSCDIDVICTIDSKTQT
ncbi:MAG: hypothetical protein ACFFC7_06320 [Candidatus Hermodarchaeota archaeon]